jgi:hypothetical protein
LKRLAKGVRLDVPGEVNTYIYGLRVSNNYKNKLFYAYQYLCDANYIPYVKPKKLHVDPYMIQIPTEEQIDRIITCCGWVYSVAYTLSKYGLRPVELSQLTARALKKLGHGERSLSKLFWLIH